MENIDDIDDLFNLDLDSIFEDGPDQLNLNSFPGYDSYSFAPELTGGVGDNGAGDAAAFSSSSLLSATPRPSSVINGPQLVSKSNCSNCTSIYRSHDTGIKVIDQNPSTSSNVQQTMQKLLHEETVSKLLLPQCNNHRQVIGVSSFNDSPALYFKWENGITCEEWLDKVQQIHPQGVEFNVRLRAAMAIAKTLSQFHQCSVAYNSLSPKNIVLTPSEGDYVAKFIDLSDSVICNDEQTFKEMTAVDLTTLGSIFDRLFQTDGGGGSADAGGDGGGGGGELTSLRRVSANSDMEREVSDNNRNVKKRGKQRTPGEGLPLYLGAMISTLLMSGDDYDASQLRYESANDVYEDLKALVTQNISHRRNSSFKEAHFDHEVIIHNRLKLPKDLFYGRQVQMSMILHLLQSSTNLGNQPLMALIAGYPGTG
jgi:hypothetical protein